MKLNDEDLKKTIKEAIQAERLNYKSKNTGGFKFMDTMSFVFYCGGFICLGFALFSFYEITIFHATCLFIISYVVSPSDGDRYEEMVKGMAKDLGYIRAHLEFLSLRTK